MPTRNHELEGGCVRQVRAVLIKLPDGKLPEVHDVYANGNISRNWDPKTSFKYPGCGAKSAGVLGQTGTAVRVLYFSQ